MEPITVAEIVAAVGGELLGSFDPNAVITEVDTDSRKMH